MSSESSRPQCEHPDFEAWVEVNRLTDTEGGPVTGYSADIKVNCKACRLPFRWVGLPAGLSPGQPMVSVDGLELRVPLAPQDSAGDFGQHLQGFRVRFSAQA